VAGETRQGYRSSKNCVAGWAAVPAKWGVILGDGDQGRFREGAIRNQV